MAHDNSDAQLKGITSGGANGLQQHQAPDTLGGSTTSGPGARNPNEQMNSNRMYPGGMLSAPWQTLIRNGFKRGAPKQNVGSVTVKEPPKQGLGTVTVKETPKPQGFGRVIQKALARGFKVGISPKDAKAPENPEIHHPETHVAGVEIPHSLREHLKAGNVIPYDHALRGEAAEFVTNVWRKNTHDGKRMSSRLLGVTEDEAPQIKPGKATIKDEMPFKKDGEAGSAKPLAPRFPSKEQGDAIQRELSGGLPNKEGWANVQQELGNLVGLGKSDEKPPEAPKPPKAAPAPHPDSPHAQRPNQRQRVKDVKADLQQKLAADPSKAKVSLSTTNSKLAKDGIASFNLVPIETCPGAGSCAKYCYADTGSYLRFWKTTMPPRVANWLASQKPDFVEKMNAMFGDVKKKGKIKAIRVHDSGDFYSPDYIKKWTEIARANPELMFYAYTKSHHPKLREHLNELEKLPNFNVVQSLGSKYDHLIDPSKPHAVVFPDEASMKKAGYADAMASDLAAADKNNRKVGLYIHGQYDKSYPGLEEHLKANPRIYQEVMEALGKGPLKKTEPKGLRRLIKSKA